MEIFFSYNSTSRLLALRKLMTRMPSVVSASINGDERRLKTELSNSIKAQATLLNIEGILG
jgi:hypothetical protein